jgi:hypothetical protein
VVDIGTSPPLARPRRCLFAEAFIYAARSDFYPPKRFYGPSWCYASALWGVTDNDGYSLRQLQGRFGPERSMAS